MKKYKFTDKAQSMIEFTFAMVVVALLIFGVIKVFQWIGMDYAQKAYTRQNTGLFTPASRPDRLDAFTKKF